MDFGRLQFSCGTKVLFGFSAGGEAYACLNLVKRILGEKMFTGGDVLEEAERRVQQRMTFEGHTRVGGGVQHCAAV